MARCVFICTYVLVTLLVTCKSSAKILQRDFCLDPVLSFVTAQYSCQGFQGHNVNHSFQEGTTSACHATCQIKLDYHYTDRNRYHLKLEFVSLEFEGYNYSTKTGCSSARTAKLYINCSRWRKEQLGIIWSNNCSERHADCFKWFGFCICHCEPGYLMIDGGCLQIKSSSTNIGLILGALLGGLLIGVVITAGFGFVTYKRFRSNVEQRKEPLVLFSMNDTYGRTKNDDILPEEPHVHQDEQERVVNVSLLTGSEDLPEYNNIARKQNVMKVTDDVYNHLNEKDKNEDDDNYDRACAAATSGHVNDLSDFSSHQGIDDDYEFSTGTGTNVYANV